MIDKWLITGDCHGQVSKRLEEVIQKYPDRLNEIGLVILGDVGLNYWGNNTDRNKKIKCEEYGIYLYCVRGNHEKRPSDVEGMRAVYDKEVAGLVYMEDAYPHIRYLIDGGEYTINGFKVLVLGGAYSVDKWWRLLRANGKFSGWFENEQLNEDERNHIMNQIKMKDKTYDFVFSHTCPLSFQPTDLFLSFVNQAEVDNSMELWMEEIKDTISWNIWCFGHYHADRTEKACVEQYFNEIEDLNIVQERWKNYREEEQLTNPREGKSPQWARYGE